MLSNKKNVSNSSMHIFSNILFCLKFLYKNNKKLFFIRIPSTIILSLSNFISIIFVRYIINEITNGNSFFSVILYVLGMVITHLIINVLNSWLSKLDSKEVEITTYKMNLFLANLAMKMRYSDLEDPRMKDFISLAGSVNPFLDILTYSTGFISALFTSIGFSAIIMTIHPILLALIIVVIIVQMIVDKKMRKYQDGWRHETAPLYRKQIFLFNLVRETRFGKEIRMNSIESWILRKIHKFHEKELWVADKKIEKQ